MILCRKNISNDDEGLRINASEISERKTPTVEVIEGASCGDILTALWEDYGFQHWKVLVFLEMRASRFGKTKQKT